MYAVLLLANLEFSFLYQTLLSHWGRVYQPQLYLMCLLALGVAIEQCVGERVGIKAVYLLAAIAGSLFSQHNGVT